MDIILEDTRRDLLSTSRKGKREKDGFTRYQKRLQNHLTNNKKYYNRLNMNDLFRNDIFNIEIEVRGETDNYIIKISFSGFLDELYKLIKNKDYIEFRDIIKALITAFNRNDVYIMCTCLHPDTRIKLLDGSTPTVSEMYERYNSGEKLYVYSVNKDGNFEPDEVEKVWITGQASNFIKVTLDNNKSVITTPDHLFMLRDGSFKQAAELHINDSLMPLYSHYKNGYEQIKDNSDGRFRSVYKQVANYYKTSEIAEAKDRSIKQKNEGLNKMSYDVAIHHKDFNKLNNNPDNLQIMTGYEHWYYHSSLMKDRWRDPEFAKKQSLKASKWMISLNANPTEAMIASRKLTGKQNSIILNSDKNKKKFHNIRSNSTKANWANGIYDCLEVKAKKAASFKAAVENGCFTTERFKAAAKQRGVDMHTPEREELSRIGVQKYWANLSEEAKAERARIARQNLKIACDKIKGKAFTKEHKEKISKTRLSKTQDFWDEVAIKTRDTKINKIIDIIKENNWLFNEEGYKKAWSTGYPSYAKFSERFYQLVAERQLNHRIINIEKINLPTTNVFDIKTKNNHNFLTGAGVILHNCPDWFYRFGYWATIKKYNSGQPQLIPSDETNPNNDLGAGCKHVLLVLSNSSWIMKAATVINNYIKYMQRYRQTQYDSIIYPAIYRKKKPVQLSLVDDETIISDNDEEINQQGSRLRNRKPKQVDSKSISNNSSQPDNNEDETNG